MVISTADRLLQYIIYTHTCEQSDTKHSAQKVDIERKSHHHIKDRERQLLNHNQSVESSTYVNSQLSLFDPFTSETADPSILTTAMSGHGDVCLCTVSVRMSVLNDHNIQTVS